MKEIEIINDWVELSEVDFTDNATQIHCDTRDFGCFVLHSEIKKIADYPTLKKYSAFFSTIDEVKDVLIDLYNRSGGAKNWRFLTFVNGYGGWVKYIRIFKTESGYLMGVGEGQEKYRFFKKDFFKGELSRE